jgi:hypothetical protein
MFGNAVAMHTVHSIFFPIATEKFHMILIISGHLL